MATNDTYVRDPEDDLDYLMDWGKKWLADGETIITSDWAIVGTGTLTIHDPDNTDTTTTIWVTDGTAGTDYRVRNRITTSAGRTVDRSLTFVVMDR